MDYRGIEDIEYFKTQEGKFKQLIQISRNCAMFLHYHGTNDALHVVEFLYRKVPNEFLPQILQSLLLNTQGSVIDINSVYEYIPEYDNSKPVFHFLQDVHGMNLIHYLVHSSDVDTMTEVLFTHTNIDLSIQNRDGNTPLMLCILFPTQRKKFEILLGYLIAFKSREERKKCLDVQNRDGQTLLNMIIRLKSDWDEEINRLLIEGANSNLMDSNSYVPVVYAMKRVGLNHLAALNERTEMITKTLKMISSTTSFENTYKNLLSSTAFPCKIVTMMIRVQLVKITLSSIRIIHRLCNNKSMKKAMTPDMIRLLLEILGDWYVEQEL